mmetsp:Transcript_137929/g.384658  ORF Transcript_137929/g.384658 Transcript_137929/m.384658 type:complete len:309 (+) Transcript_137929:186-1112(+)
MQVHSGIAVPWHEQQLVAQRGQRGATAHMQDRVLVPAALDPGCTLRPTADQRRARVIGDGLQPGVQDHAARRLVAADDRGGHEEALPPARDRRSPGVQVSRVVGVAEHVAAGLHFRVDPAGHVELARPRAPAGDDFTAKAGLGERTRGGSSKVGGTGCGRGPLAVVPHVLREALVGLDASEVQALELRKPLGEHDRVGGRADAAPVLAHVHVDEHAEPYALPTRGCRQHLSRLQRVHHGRHTAASPCNRGQTPCLRRRGDLVRQQDVAHGISHGHGLRNLLATDTHSPRLLHLQNGYLDSLVALDVRP